jgi:hypothetical protein
LGAVYKFLFTDFEISFNITTYIGINAFAVAVYEVSGVLNMRRAQAAMEFLMTYGWMLLVLLVVIITLIGMGMFKPPKSPSCVFPANFVCNAYKLTTDGNLTLDLYQNTGHRINVRGINCTKSIDPNLVNPQLFPVNVYIKNSDHEVVANGTNVRCFDDSGQVTSGVIGSSYSGKILLYYVENDTGMPHLIVGSITVNYE